jgi:hypothetical protein
MTLNSSSSALRRCGLPLLALLAAGSAGAQDLAAYRALAGSLDAAARVRPASAERALAELDRAEEALARLAPTLQNRQLVGGLRDALGSARGALARTPAEVQAQVLLARGLMRKALYDQTLTAVPGSGAAQVNLLAREFGLSGASAGALGTDAAAGRPERVAWRLQRVAAGKVAAALDAARPERSTASYVNLARATGWFTAVQDAGAAGDLRAAQFTAALEQLTAGDTAALTSSLTALRQGSAALSRSLATPPATPVQEVAQAQSPSGAVTPPAATPTPDPEAAPDPLPTPATSPSGSADSLETAYAALGRALTASGHGDPEAARSELSRAADALSPLPPALRGAEGYEVFAQDLTAASERRGLRPGDVQALIAGLGGLERAAAGEARSAVDNASAGAARTLSGGLRALVFLLLALLAPLPLYLLHLAFGGRNPFWRAITAALALLLLPVVLEGVFGFLGWLGDVTGVAALRAAPSLTLWQGAYGLPLRALLTALAIGLATYGFRGLCVQFGLLGGRAAGQPLQPVLDWEEEL